MLRILLEPTITVKTVTYKDKHEFIRINLNYRKGYTKCRNKNWILLILYEIIILMHHNINLSNKRVNREVNLGYIRFISR